MEIHGDLRAQRNALAHVIKAMQKRKSFAYMSIEVRLRYYALNSLLADIDAEIINRDIKLGKR